MATTSLQRALLKALKRLRGASAEESAAEITRLLLEERAEQQVRLAREDEARAMAAQGEAPVRGDTGVWITAAATAIPEWSLTTAPEWRKSSSFQFIPRRKPFDPGLVLQGNEELRQQRAKKPKELQDIPARTKRVFGDSP